MNAGVSGASHDNYYSYLDVGGPLAFDGRLRGRTVLYLFPMTGRPDVALPPGWDEIPGARGCTPQSCAFRDHFAELKSLGAAQLFGVSTQDTAYQCEAVARLHLPFPLLSDHRLSFATALGLPVFEVQGLALLKRLTLIARDGVIELLLRFNLYRGGAYEARVEQAAQALNEAMDRQEATCRDLRQTLAIALNEVALRGMHIERIAQVTIERRLDFIAPCCFASGATGRVVTWKFGNQRAWQVTWCAVSHPQTT